MSLLIEGIIASLALKCLASVGRSTMSWTVDGVRYHSLRERDEAIRRRNERQTRAEADHARQLVGDLRDRIRQRELDLDQARGDMQRQIQISEEIRADVSQLRRAQGRLEQAHQALEQQMEAEFREVRQDIQATQAEVAELERAHEAHVAEVRKTFQEVRIEVQRGLEEAEERRRQTEERLQSEIRRVDEKVEEDRRKRLEQIKSEMARAEEAVRTVEAALREVDSDLAALDLGEEAQAIREQLAQARGSLDRKDSAAALAVANGGFGQARALQFRVRSRRAALNAYRSAIAAKVEGLQRALSVAEVQEWFPHEAAQASDLLSQVAERSEHSYQRHARMEIHAARDEEVLELLDQHVALMLASAPDLRELSAERKAQAKLIIGKLTKVYGPLASPPHQRFSREGDPKSPLVIECRFGGARVDVHVALDGSFTLDGYGHESNATCSARAKSIVSEIGREQQIRRQQVSAENRTEPAAPVETRTPVWNRLAGALDETRRKL